MARVTVESLHGKLNEIKLALAQSKERYEQLTQELKKLESIINQQIGSQTTCEYWLSELTKDTAESITPEELKKRLLEGENDPNDVEKVMNQVNSKLKEFKKEEKK